ncbi:hypothetical protein CR513_08272, partial [Mucuna pruriens]
MILKGTPYLGTTNSWKTSHNVLDGPREIHGLLRSYVLSHTTWLVSRMDPIKYIFEKLALTGKIARWQVALSKYDIFHVTQKVINGSVLADYLAHNPLVDYQPMRHDFPDEDL